MSAAPQKSWAKSLRWRKKPGKPVTPSSRRHKQKRASVERETPEQSEPRRQAQGEVEKKRHTRKLRVRCCTHNFHQSEKVEWNKLVRAEICQHNHKKHFSNKVVFSFLTETKLDIKRRWLYRNCICRFVASLRRLHKVSFLLLRFCAFSPST